MLLIGQKKTQVTCLPFTIIKIRFKKYIKTKQNQNSQVSKRQNKAKFYMCSWVVPKKILSVLVKSTYEKNITDLIKEAICMRRGKNQRFNNKTLDKFGI